MRSQSPPESATVTMHPPGGASHALGAAAAPSETERPVPAGRMGVDDGVGDRERVAVGDALTVALAVTLGVPDGVALGESEPESVPYSFLESIGQRALRTTFQLNQSTWSRRWFRSTD